MAGSNTIFRGKTLDQWLVLLAAPTDDECLLRTEEAFRAMGSAEARRLLGRALLYDEEDDRSLYAWAAVELIGAAAVPVLLPVLGHDDDRVRWDAMIILSTVVYGTEFPVDESFLQAVWKRVRDEPDDDVRTSAVEVMYAAVQGLSGARLDRVLADVLDLSRSEDARDRLVAVSFLGDLSLRRPAAVTRLTESLSDRAPSVRRAAVDALVGLDPGNPGVEEALALAAGSEDPVVGLRARIAVAESEREMRAVATDLIAVVRRGGTNAQWAGRWLEARVGLTVHATALIAEALDSSRAEARSDAARALGGAGESAAHATAKLVDLASGDDSDTVRASALVALAGIGALRASVVDLLPDALRSEDEGVRLGALTLGRSLANDRARALDALLAYGSEGAPSARSDVIRVLAEAGSVAAEAAPLALAELRDPRAGAVDEAVGLLVATAPDAPGVFDALAARARGQGDFSSTAAVEALEHYGAAGVPVLMDVLRDAGEFAHWRALSVLGRLGAPARAAVVADLESPESVFRSQNVGSLHRLGVSAELAVPVLREALNSDRADVRSAAASGLFEYGAATQDAESTLRGLLTHADVRVRLSAADDLVRYTDDPAFVLPTLIAALGETAWAEDVAYRLLALGSRAVGAVPALRDQLRPGIPATDASAAITVLAGLGDPARAAVPELVAVVRSPDRDHPHEHTSCMDGRPRLRSDALGVLAKLAPNDPRVVALLNEALDSPDADLRTTAREVLDADGHEPPDE